MKLFLLEGPGGLLGAKLAGNIGTNLPFSVGGVATGSSQSVASAATVSLTPSSSVLIHTPTQNETINFSTNGYKAGAEICLEVVTSGTTSYTLTFGTGTKNQGTLATGTVSAKTFAVSFVFDGTNWVETSRTSAM